MQMRISVLMNYKSVPVINPTLPFPYLLPLHLSINAYVDTIVYNPTKLLALSDSSIIYAK